MKVSLSGGTVDLVRRRGRVHGRDVKLSARQAEVLGYLARNAGRTVTREELLANVFGYRASNPTRAVDTILTRLRARLERDPALPENLVSVYGEGYRFVPPEPAGGALPPDRTAFLGREADLARIRDTLSEHRLVTLTGPGGIGKTRLALRIAASHPVRPIVVRALTARTDAELLALVALAVGAPTPPQWSVRSGAATVGRCLGGPALLVLDNLEQVADDVAAVVEPLLAEADDLTVLTTSRVPLGLAGEEVERIGPLDPADAVALFRERSDAVGVEATDDPTLRALVERLDRLPLAIELAAARTRTLTPARILARLGERLRVLTGGPAEDDARASSLRATLSWSWDLLEDAERVALARASVFPARITPQAAAAVLGPDAARRLAGLVRASLAVEADDGYGLLESVRAFAAEQAVALGVRDEAELAHARYHARLATEIRPQSTSTPAALARLREELPNLLVVPERVAERDPDTAIAVVLAISEWFIQRGPVDPFLAMCERALAAVPDAGDRRADLLQMRALAHRLRQRRDLALVDLDAAEAATGDEQRLARIRLDRAAMVADAGRLRDGMRWIEEVLAGPLRPQDTIVARGLLAVMKLHTREDIATAEADCRDAIVRARASGMDRIATGLQGSLGVYYAQVGRIEDAERELEAVARSARGDDDSRRGSVLTELAALRMQQRRFAEAEALWLEAEALHERFGQPRSCGIARAGRAGLALATRDPVLALRLLDEADRVLEGIGDAPAATLVEAYRAVALAALGRVDAAREALERAAANERAGVDTKGLVEAARAHVDRGAAADPPAARAVVERARQLRDRAGDRARLVIDLLAE